MGLDQDRIKKRLSQIEIDINQMNQMIDENLQLVDPAADEAVPDETDDEGVTDIPEAAETAFSNSNGEASALPQDATRPAVEHGTSHDHIPNNAGTSKSLGTQSQQSDFQTVINGKQTNHTAIPTAGTYNAFVANSVGNGESNDSDAEKKVANTANVNQGGVNIESVQNDDDEWEDEKFDVEDECIGKEPEENSVTQPFEPPNRQNIGFSGHRKANTELILDDFSSGNRDVDIQPQTISVGSNKDDNTDSQRLADRTADTSEDIPNLSGRSTPLDSQTKIFIPKKHSKEDGTAANDTNLHTQEPKKVPKSETRRQTNPFRVISVSSNSNSWGGSRKSSLNKYESSASSPITSASELGNTAKLEKRHDYLAKKCVKLQKEIDYLNKMNAQGSLSMDDGKRLHRAVVKLQEYLDRKTKEKYEVGVLLSRQLRKQIDRGENGQFWIGTK
ncbi:bni5p [Saccharomyces arboricola H-6]|uniref:Bni5p n=1 Tax=Saccharomyces arboricola (strain H-6 / AS 2.3317 / CBS 10644) TaxID=1160507 RepID=J8PZZ1_SACAR|nr:bni5p [Saccharomyces arboricola H-6]